MVNAELRPPAGIPVIGLGGSAGALAAFEAFFKSMPADSGAAFVVVQHLSPTYQSLLPEILTQHTRMRVVQARDGVPVEADCVYIIPPDRHLGLKNGVLFLAAPTPEHGLRLPIDFFFRCLAEDREERAIGILFSGAGSDGTLGARAIRGAGGMVIAQDARTALFGDMPHSAVAAGLVDHVLPPERMSEAIVQYLRHPYVKGQKRVTSPEVEGQSKEVQDILMLVLDQTGCDFRCYKPATLLRRIQRRMGLLHIQSVAQYLVMLHRDSGEVKLLLKDLLINVTAFFRDSEAFEEVRDTVLAPQIEARGGNEPLRIWVPGCSTGEEAYSLAMLLLEQQAKVGKTCPVRVFGTDLDEAALEEARAGFYPDNIAADVGPERLRKFFIRKEKGYQVKEELREVLTFATQNVITDPPFSRMDLISCRNLLIYLNAEAQTKLMALFNFALKPGGYLFLGRSETMAGQDDLFETVSKKARLYRRLTPARPLVLDSPILPGRKKRLPPAHATNGPAASNFADVVRLEMLRHFDASAVLVDRKGRILQFHGQTDRYLNLPAPGPDFDLFQLAREKLSTPLRLAMHKAIHEGKTVVLDSVPFTQVDGATCARITVAPASHRPQAEPLLVVFFEEVSGPPAAAAELLQIPENEGAIKRLGDELLASHLDLQSTIQELQSSNEDLRAANEEISSTNEELESTNEELVTSTEELQSSNEELTAVVGQLQEKVELLDKSEQRFRTMLESLPNAVLVVTADGKITLVNRQAEAMFGYARDELLGQAVEVLVPNLFRRRHPSCRAEFTAQPEHRPMGAGRDLLAVRKDGTEFPVETSLTPLEMPEGLVTMATITDITERKRLEAGA